MSISVFPEPVSSTGIPSGDTAGRPATPTIGDTYYNGELAGIEIYNGNNWIPVSEGWAPYDYPPQAPTIGTATTSGVTSDVTVTWTLNNNGGKNLTSVTITPYLNGTTAQTSTTALTTTATSATVSGLTGNSNYTFRVKATNANGDSLESADSNSVTVPPFITTDFLVVAGGGGSAGNGTTGRGGGGGGGYRTSAGTSGASSSAENPLGISPGSNFTVTVGAGGAQSTNGVSSVLSNISTVGGGRADFAANGDTGGSGGGGSSSGSGGAGTAGQGRAGGNGGGSNTGGGGGGAANSGNGGSDANNTGGNGGNGLASSITGNSVTRAGGGAGGGSTSNGNAGNGAGAAANGGGGGSGGHNSGASNPQGGSGIVVIRYSDAFTATVGAGLTSTTNTSGSNKITTFNAGTGTVSLA